MYSYIHILNTKSSGGLHRLSLLYKVKPCSCLAPCVRRSRRRGSQLWLLALRTHRALLGRAERRPPPCPWRRKRNLCGWLSWVPRATRGRSWFGCYWGTAAWRLKCSRETLRREMPSRRYTLSSTTLRYEHDLIDTLTVQIHTT